MSTLNIPLELKGLMERNMSVVFQFAFSHTSLEQYCGQHFQGEQKNLGLVVFELAQHRATQAFLELALYLRALDDEEDLNGVFSEIAGLEFGNLSLKSDQTRPMTLRDIANKVIHGTGYRWEFPSSDAPKFVCDARGVTQNWHRAEIDIGKLMIFCSMLSPGLESGF